MFEKGGSLKASLSRGRSAITGVTVSALRLRHVTHLETIVLKVARSFTQQDVAVSKHGGRQHLDDNVERACVPTRVEPRDVGRPTEWGVSHRRLQRQGFLFDQKLLGARWVL